MIRHSLNRTLSRVYWILGGVLALSLVAKAAPHVPGLAGTPVERGLGDLYDYMKDMALVFVTVVAAYLANVFQKRSKFVEALEREWRGIVRTKSELYTFCEKSYPTADDYLTAFCRISETLDNMRIVYRNVGETRRLIGLYPFEPLHDMRRALMTLDPRKNGSITPEQRKLVRDAILQSFYALRETFLDELDLEEPHTAILAYRARRTKGMGALASALRERDRQQTTIAREPVLRPDIDHLLAELKDRERNGETARRNGSGPGKDARDARDAGAAAN